MGLLLAVYIYKYVSVEREENQSRFFTGETAGSDENKSATETGWVIIDYNYYYVLETGEYAKNQLVDNYYLGSDGIMITDQWADTETGKKYFARDGKMCTLCFYEIDGVLNYFNADGEIDNSPGLKKQGADWYYLGEDGELVKSQRMENLYFNAEGVLVLYDSWFESPMGMQYYDADGDSCVNRVMDIEDKLYYFDSDGILATNQYVDRFYVGDDGQWGDLYRKGLESRG